MTSEVKGLLALATSIADGDDIDWPQVEARLSTGTPHERALLQSLRLIASIGEVHRSTEEDGPGDDLLAPRGRVVGRIAPVAPAATDPASTAATVASAAPFPELASTNPAITPDVPPAEEPGGSGSRSQGRGAPPADAGAATPERWGSMAVRERVGAGVFGEVYRAYDEQLQREVALKLLRIGSRSAERLAGKVLHEGRLLARVRHPNVVLVHGVEARGDRVGLWMEFIRGCTLEQLLERQGLFGAREAALIGQDLCRALAAVHAAGLVHRDVKAQNVMREEGGRVVLMDFGAGTPVREDEAGAAAPAAGTPLYLAPELLEGGEATVASDLYSLGVLLYHLVTGSYPVTAASLADLREAHRRGRRRLHDARPDLPDAFVQAVDRALAPEPGDRHASAGVMQEALTRALGIDAPAAAETIRPLVGPVEPAQARPLRAADVVRRPARAWMIGAGAAVVLAAFALVMTWWRTPPPGPINSVVVLPLANISSADRDLAEGINVLVLEQLSTLPALRIIHYTASMASQDKGMPVSEIVRRAQADAAISGSVDWSGARARVFLQLVRAGASTPAWVKQFDVPARRAAELPRTVARDVAGALAVTLTPADELALAGHDDGEPEAFEAYLRARVQMRAATVPAVKQAIELLERALQRDPSHAPSWAALADCYIIQAVSQRVRSLDDAAGRAREAADKALQLDNQLPEAYQTLAEVRFYKDWDWAGAEEAFRQAIAYRPNSGDLRTRYAMFLASRKRLPDAMQEVHQAVALDPVSPMANAALGMLWHYARSDDQAERIYRGVLEGDPGFYPARMGLIRTYIRTRRFEQALKEIDRFRADVRGELSTGQQSLLALAYAGLGRRAEAEAIAERLEREEPDQPSVDAAGVYVALDEHEKALDLLERAVEIKSYKVLFLRLDTRFDALLSEPRFRGLLRRMGFPS